MGKKLSEKENIYGISALQDYKREFSSYGEMLVIAKKDNEVIFNGRVTVGIGDYNIYFKVDIIWDDVEPNYHDIGLFGYYSTNYCKMKYANGILTIEDGNGIVIDITK